MTPKEYIRKIIDEKKSPNLSYYDPRLTDIKKVIRKWADTRLSQIKLSGSCVKKTAIQGKSDCDLFISLKSDTKETLKELYYSLNDAVKAEGYTTREQNVSIGIQANGLKIDLVPAKIQAGKRNFHSLYLRRRDSWLKTNIDIHINKILASGRQEEIMALKIWRELNALKFPSVYLEMVILEALKNKNKNQPAKNFLSILEYLSSSFLDKKIDDPSNTNNCISDMIFKYQKEEIVRKAKASLEHGDWENIIW